jgi:hypothetical protein
MLKINRLALSRLIEKKGEEMLPCSAYIKAGKPELCKVLLEKSKRCRECVRKGFARYDVSSIPARSLAVLIKEEEKLKLEREAAFRSAIKSIARVNRL